MNSQEKRWINNWLHKIWITDNETDFQADDINDFLWELARKAGYQLIRKEQNKSDNRKNDRCL